MRISIPNFVAHRQDRIASTGPNQFRSPGNGHPNEWSAERAGLEVVASPAGVAVVAASPVVEVARVAASLVAAVGAVAKVVGARVVDAVGQAPVVAVGVGWHCRGVFEQAPRALEAKRSSPLLVKR